MIPQTCCSAHRCNDITCETCAWRHTRQVTHRILQGWPGPFYTVTLTILDPSPRGFRRARVELRNRLDYLRRKTPVWRNFGFLLYRVGDGTLQGIAALGGLGPADIQQGLGGRWPMTLRPILPEDLRLEVWRCMRPAVMAPAVTERGGYQAVRLSIGPCRSVLRATVTSDPTDLADPMPVVF